MNDFEKLIKASDLIGWIMETYPDWCVGAVRQIVDHVEDMPSAQPKICEGCKHLGKWENEVEYGYPSPCTRCRRRVEDHYER